MASQPSVIPAPTAPDSGPEISTVLPAVPDGQAGACGDVGMAGHSGSQQLPASLHPPHFFDVPTLLQSQRGTQPLILGSDPEGGSQPGAGQAQHGAHPAGGDGHLGPDAAPALPLAHCGPGLGPPHNLTLLDPAMLSAAAAATLGPSIYFAPPFPLPALPSPHDGLPTIKHPSLAKPEHEDSKAKRRGPMDEMRQLVRIMVKFLPQSVRFLSAADEPGGGNRVTEPQIKNYLKATLGTEAPQPQWGMPQGWGSYLAELFTWALGREISDEEARSCACRLQGRSWQVKESRLAELGIFAYAWPLPLTREGVQRAQASPGEPPHNTSFLGPPPGWPHAELPYYRDKAARLTRGPALRSYSRGELDGLSEAELLQAATPLLKAAAERAMKRQATRRGSFPDDLLHNWQSLGALCASIAPPAVALELAPAVMDATATAAARERARAQIGAGSPRRFGRVNGSAAGGVRGGGPQNGPGGGSGSGAGGGVGKSLDALMDAVAHLRHENGDGTASESERSDAPSISGGTARKRRKTSPSAGTDGAAAGSIGPSNRPSVSGRRSSPQAEWVDSAGTDAVAAQPASVGDAGAAAAPAAAPSGAQGAAVLTAGVSSGVDAEVLKSQLELLSDAVVAEAIAALGAVRVQGLMGLPGAGPPAAAPPVPANIQATIPGTSAGPAMDADGPTA